MQIPVLALVVVALSPAAVRGDMVGPLPLVFGSYAGAIADGQTDSVMCTLTFCPEDPICAFTEVDFKAKLQAGGSEGDRITVRAETWTGMVAAVAQGPAGTAEIQAHQGDDCLELWVEGTQVELKRAAYVLEVEYLVR